MNRLLQNAFVPTKLARKEITVTDQTTGEQFQAVVYVKPLSFASATGDLLAYGGTPEQRMAQRIASSICNENGEPIFTADQICGDEQQLSADLTVQLLALIGDVSAVGKMEA